MDLYFDPFTQNLGRPLIITRFSFTSKLFTSQIVSLKPKLTTTSMTHDISRQMSSPLAMPHMSTNSKGSRFCRQNNLLQSMMKQIWRQTLKEEMFLQNL